MTKKGSESDKIMIRFTEDFWVYLDLMMDTDSSEVAYKISELANNLLVRNIMRIEEIDISEKLGKFSVKIGKSAVDIGINAFLKNYFPNELTDREIGRYVANHNQVIEANLVMDDEDEEEEDWYSPLQNKYADEKKSGQPEIEVPRFSFNPKNVKATFISLVTETYPYGHEEEVHKYLTPGLSQDKHGNLYKVIGNADTAFTCHLDTASRTKESVGLIEFEKDGDTFIKTNGKTILGADDKSGVTVLMYMIAHNIPGVYWFFIGEERGGLGSRAAVKDIDQYPFMKGIKKVVSFDRRNYYSVITSQMGVDCCSNEFGLSLCSELNKHGMEMKLDPTGVFTDSANFIDDVPECTNVSVGYFDEHRTTEMQNISHLERLCKACVSVDWANLVVKRSIGIENQVLSKKYQRAITDLRKLRLVNKINLKSQEDKIIVDMDIINGDLDGVSGDFDKLEELFAKYRINADLTFHESTIKIVFG